MAGPSSFVPSSVTPSTAKQRFTLAQANRSLPLVSRIVRDIVATHTQVAKLQGQTGKQSKQNAQAKNADEVAHAMDRLQTFVEELGSLGVELKDYQAGLVDFIGRHQGRDVYLCWKLGEEHIGFWHELHTGFTGRQPISTLEERD